jgi:hypothetical protein
MVRAQLSVDSTRGVESSFLRRAGAQTRQLDDERLHQLALRPTVPTVRNSAKNHTQPE